MSQMWIDGFNAEAFWAPHEVKKWVVYLSRGNGKKKEQAVVIVGAESEEGAKATAKFNSPIKGRVQCWVRLARPGRSWL